MFSRFCILDSKFLISLISFIFGVSLLDTSTPDTSETWPKPKILSAEICVDTLSAYSLAFSIPNDGIETIFWNVVFGLIALVLGIVALVGSKTHRPSFALAVVAVTVGGSSLYSLAAGVLVTLVSAIPM